MVGEEVVRSRNVYLQTKINSMAILIREYKESIDKCDTAGISSAATSLGEIGETLKIEIGEMLKGGKQYLTSKQVAEIEGLKRAHNIQFQRLNIGRVCECHPNIKN